MTKFLHTCVRVKDLEASLKFYKEALGFKEARRNDFPEYKFTLVYLQLEDDPDYELELTYNLSLIHILPASICLGTSSPLSVLTQALAAI